MDERMRFVIQLKDGETMAFLCREFGISRKTVCLRNNLLPMCPVRTNSKMVRRGGLVLRYTIEKKQLMDTLKA